MVAVPSNSMNLICSLCGVLYSLLLRYSIRSMQYEWFIPRLEQALNETMLATLSAIDFIFIIMASYRFAVLFLCRFGRSNVHVLASTSNVLLAKRFLWPCSLRYRVRTYGYCIGAPSPPLIPHVKWQSHEWQVCFSLKRFANSNGLQVGQTSQFWVLR